MVDDDLTVRLRAISGSNQQNLVEIRRSIHRHPEVGWAEHRTHAVVAAALRGSGLAPRLDHKTALVYELPLGPAKDVRGPIVALRADMDALPIADEKAVEYRSVIPGVCHACGHDAHTAMLIGVGQALSQLSQEFPSGVVRLIFQPAEEQMPGGGQYLTELGVMRDVNLVFGLHCDPSLPVGSVGIRSGVMTWGCDTVRIRLLGLGGHTARPERSTNVLALAARIVRELPAALGARTEASHPVRLVFGFIRSGSAPNSIPSTAELAGTIRTATQHDWHDAVTWVEGALSDITRSEAATVELEVGRGSPPVENDPKATELLAGAVRRALGPEAVRTVPASLGADDFAWYLKHARGSYCRLGVRPQDVPSSPDLHSAQFDIDERAIGVGVRVLLQVVHDALAYGCPGRTALENSQKRNAE